MAISAEIERRGPLAPQERVVVGRGPAGHHHPIYAERQHGEDVEEAHVERHRLERDHPIADAQGVAEGNGREGGQGKEHRHERSQREEQAVGARGTEVLLGQHLQRVGERMEQPEDAQAEDGRAVGADAVLHDGRLLALDPGEEAPQVQHHEHHEGDGSEPGEEVAGDGAHDFTICPASPSPR